MAKGMHFTRRLKKRINERNSIDLSFPLDSGPTNELRPEAFVWFDETNIIAQFKTQNLDRRASSSEVLGDFLVAQVIEPTIRAEFGTDLAGTGKMIDDYYYLREIHERTFHGSATCLQENWVACHEEQIIKVMRVQETSAKMTEVIEALITRHGASEIVTLAQVQRMLNPHCESPTKKNSSIVDTPTDNASSRIDPTGINKKKRHLTLVPDP